MADFSVDGNGALRRGGSTGMSLVISSRDQAENGLRGFGISTADKGDTMDIRAGASCGRVADGGDISKCETCLCDLALVFDLLI